MRDVGAERGTGHQASSTRGATMPVCRGASHKCRRVPVALRHGGEQARARWAAAIALGHVGRGAGFIEDTNRAGSMKRCQTCQRRRLCATLGRFCSAALNVFFYVSGRAGEARLWIVESPAPTPKRRCSTAWSSASVVSGVAATSRHRSLSCGSSTRRRYPPIAGWLDQRPPGGCAATRPRRGQGRSSGGADPPRNVNRT